MSYLDNSTITIDAVLTKRGRELFSQGKFRVTKFALSDDEVDYRLYNMSHPSGSAYYSTAILNMPVLEALPEGGIGLKSKLLTLPKGGSLLPIISIGTTSITLRAPISATYTQEYYPGGAFNPDIPDVAVGPTIGETYTVNPTTTNGNNKTSGYSLEIYDTSYVRVTPYGTPHGIGSISGQTGHFQTSGQKFTLQALSLGTSKPNYSVTTKMVIKGVDTGGSVEVNLTIQNPGA